MTMIIYLFFLVGGGGGWAYFQNVPFNNLKFRVLHFNLWSDCFYNNNNKFDWFAGDIQSCN